MLTVSAMQPYFFPYLGYFQLLEASASILLHDQLKYIKRGFMHRNAYLQPGVGAKSFGPELQAKTTSGNIQDVCLSVDTRWRRQILSRLESAYGSTRFFNDVMPLVESVVNEPFDRLSELNIASIRMVRDYLEIDCDIIVVSQSLPQLEPQVLAERAPSVGSQSAPVQTPSPDVKHRRIIEICKLMASNHFVNPIGGIELYDRDLLDAHGVQIEFIQSELPAYAQLHSQQFVPYLSILDALFNCSRDDVKAQLLAYSLV